MTAPDINSSMTTEQETKEQDHALDSEADAVSTAATTQRNVTKENANELRSSEEFIVDGDERDLDQSPVVGSPAQQTPQTGNEDAAIDEDECEHEYEHSPLLESPTQTPQTGNEDATDEHSSSTVGKQSSPGLSTFSVAMYSFSDSYFLSFHTLAVHKRRYLGRWNRW